MCGWGCASIIVPGFGLVSTILKDLRLNWNVKIAKAIEGNGICMLDYKAGQTLHGGALAVPGVDMPNLVRRSRSRCLLLLPEQSTNLTRNPDGET